MSEFSYFCTSAVSVSFPGIFLLNESGNSGTIAPSSKLHKAEPEVKVFFISADILVAVKEGRMMMMMTMK